MMGVADGTQQRRRLRTRSWLRMTPGASVPLIIGRDDELEDLERLLESARNRQGRAVFLIGEEGIGKSRLVHEVTSRSLARGMCVMRGRGSAVGSAIPLRPLTEALQRLCRSGGPLGEGELGPYAD